MLQAYYGSETASELDRLFVPATTCVMNKYGFDVTEVVYHRATNVTKYYHSKLLLTRLRKLQPQAISSLINVLRPVEF